MNWKWAGGGVVSWLWHLDNKIPQEQAFIHHWNTLNFCLTVQGGPEGALVGLWRNELASCWKGAEPLLNHFEWPLFVQQQWSIFLNFWLKYKIYIWKYINLKCTAQWIFVKWTYLSNQPPGKETEYYLNPRSPFQSPTFFPKVNNPLVLPGFELHINGIVYYIFFCVWRLLPQVVFVRVIHMVVLFVCG